MARSKWLDEATDLPLVQQEVDRLATFTAALADGVVDRRELDAQQDRVAAAMKAVEDDLDDSQHARVTTLLLELSAYNIMRTLREVQLARARHTFAD